jgi:beta-lactamase superfamily II metal-dependent hydrolase
MAPAGTLVPCLTRARKRPAEACELQFGPAVARAECAGGTAFCAVMSRPRGLDTVACDVGHGLLVGATWLACMLDRCLAGRAIDIHHRGTSCTGHFSNDLTGRGQGLWAVIEIHSDVLVYDTGPRFSAYFNAGDAVVLPLLRHAGIAYIEP